MKCEYKLLGRQDKNNVNIRGSNKAIILYGVITGKLDLTAICNQLTGSTEAKEP